MSAVIRNISSFLLSNMKYNNVRLMKMSSQADFKTLSLTVPKPFVYHVQLNRPEKRNSQTGEMWIEIEKCFNNLSTDPDCRVVVISGAGKMFTAGLDFQFAMENGEEIAKHEDVARKAQVFRKMLEIGQASFTSLEKCNKPVLAAIHSGCIGAGIDLVSAADIRYCTKDAWFQVKETLIGMAADVGTLQRFPKIVGSEGLVRELCFTGRKFDAKEAERHSFVTRVYEDKESMIGEVMKIAEQIAANSPVAVQMTKRSIVYSRDHSMQDSLDHIANWNQLLLQSEDFMTGVMAIATKDTNIVYSKL